MMRNKLTGYVIFLFLILPGSMYGTGINVALKANAFASSYHSNDHDASHAIDDDLATYWQASNSNMPQHLTLDLKEFYFLSKVQQTFNNSSVWKFKIEASVDNENWITLSDKTKGIAGITFGISAKGIFRYVRLTILGSSDHSIPSSKEFTVIGTKDGNNIALGKKFITSTGQLYSEPDKATDGDMSTYWCAKDGSYPKSLILDLNSPCIVTGVQQVFKDYDTWKYKIEGSNDRLHWSMLDDKSKGERLVESFAKVDGEFRYIKLTVLGSSSGFWSNSCEFRVFGFEKREDMNLESFATQYNSSLETKKAKWWKDTSGLIRYYCKLYKNQLSAITDSLDILKSQGFNIIELMCPYKGDANIWAGLGATDNYDIDPSIGTMKDFEKLIEEAHARDMKIFFFGNVGYCSADAPFFQKACDDERNKVDSKERKWFGFSKVRLNECWFWSDRAKAYYFSNWGNTDGAEGRIPSYNFNNQEWRDECRNYLNFWASKGIDGFYLDAPEVYYGITDKIVKEYIVDVLNSYERLSTNAEGSGDFSKWIGNYKFNCIQGFDMYGWGGGGRSETLIAMRNNNASHLNNLLKGYRDRVTSMHGVTLTPPMWETKATIDERIFETAYLTTMGTLFANHCGDKQLVGQSIMMKWSEKDRERFHDLVRTQNSYVGLAPSGQRTTLPTNDEISFTAFKRSNDDGNVSALVIFNFRNREEKITIDLKNSGIHTDQVPVNLLDGSPAEPIKSDQYTVSLPAYGYKILGVQNTDYYATPTGQELIKKESLNLSIYPNPFFDKLNIECPENIKFLNIFSLTGNLIKQHINLPKNSTIWMDNSSPGIYIVETLDCKDNLYKNKIVKSQ